MRTLGDIAEDRFAGEVAPEDDVFGLWAERDLDALGWERGLRSEWDDEREASAKAAIR